MQTTRAEVSKKAWATRRANEQRLAQSPPNTDDRVAVRVHKYPSNPRIDEAIREAYRQFRNYNNRTALTALAKRIGWPKHRVNGRGCELGLARAKELYWSEEETAIVAKWGHLTDKAIQTKLQNAGFARTLTAVHLKVKRLRIKKNLDGYSATKLAEAFGVDPKTVTKWINRGMLQAERRGTHRTDKQNGDTFWITNESVKTFVQRYPDEVDLAKVEKWWFLDLVTGGKISDRTVEAGQLRNQVSALRSQISALVAAARVTGEQIARLKSELHAATEKARKLSDAEALHKPKRKALQKELAQLDLTVAQLQGRRVTREDVMHLHGLAARIAATLNLPAELVAESAAVTESVESLISAVRGMAS